MRFAAAISLRSSEKNRSVATPARRHAASRSQVWVVVVIAVRMVSMANIVAVPFSSLVPGWARNRSPKTRKAAG
jgi:hypothetical protein